MVVWLKLVNVTAVKLQIEEYNLVALCLLFLCNIYYEMTRFRSVLDCVLQSLLRQNASGVVSSRSASTPS